MHGREEQDAGAEARPLLRVAVVGHVDHGKSALVDRLLTGTGGPQAGRDRAMPADSSQIRFATPARDYALIDLPDDRALIEGLVGGPFDCDAALVVVDAGEAARGQACHHGVLLHLLGVSQIAVAVTGMDRAGLDDDRFNEIEQALRAQLGALGVAPGAVIPVSARDGDNIAARSARTGWYQGPTLMEALEGLVPSPPPVTLPLRIPVRDVYRRDARRIIAGRVESGRIGVGDQVLFSPSNRAGVVTSIESEIGDAPVETAVAGDSVGFTLAEEILVERGEVVSHTGAPPIETNVFRARLFWLGDVPLQPGSRYTLRSNTAETVVRVDSIDRVIDAARMVDEPDAAQAARGCAADVVLRAQRVLALDPASANPRTGRIVLASGDDIVGVGLIDMTGYPDQRQVITRRATNIVAVKHRVTADARAERARHRGGVLWFTGLSGAGKSTLAIELERQLFELGYNVYVLDGDNLRHGLNANLGFSPEDRAENIRRVGEVAALFADAGMLVISAFISPYREDRARARSAAGDRFHEVYIRAGVEVCEQRDPKGLYARARTGEIANFTGISAPYESPEACELIVDTATHPVERSLARLLDYVARNFPLRP